MKLLKREKDENKMRLIDLPRDLLKHYIMIFAAALLVALIGVVVLMQTGVLKYFFLMLIVAGSIVAFAWFQILKYMEGDVLEARGECIDFGKSGYLKRKFVLLYVENQGLYEYLEIYNDRLFKRVEEGNIVTVYIPKGALIEENADTKKVASLYHYTIEKTGKKR